MAEQQTAGSRRPAAGRSPSSRSRGRRRSGCPLFLRVGVVAAAVLVLLLAASVIGANAQATTSATATTAAAGNKPKSPSGNRRRSSSSSGSKTAASPSSGPVRSSSSEPVLGSSSSSSGGRTPLNGGPTMRLPRPSATPDEAFERARAAKSDFPFLGQYLGPAEQQQQQQQQQQGPVLPGPSAGGVVLPPLAPAPATPATPGAPATPATPATPAPGAPAASCGPGQRTCGPACCNGATERCEGGTSCVPLLPLPPSAAPGGTPPPPPPPPPAPGGGATPAPPASLAPPGGSPSTPPPPPPPEGGGGDTPPAPPPPTPPSGDGAPFACGKTAQCTKGQQCIVYDEPSDDVECCDATSVCRLDDEYTECCADDQVCVVDDSDEEGKMRVCEDKNAVCGGRSDCNPDDGFVCVGDKVCCMDKDEKPCDPTGGTSRVCCDQTIYDCKMEDGQYDCYDKADAGGRRRRMLSRVPRGAAGSAVPAWARSGGGSKKGGKGGAPGERRRAEERARRPWRTEEGRARRRAEQLASRRGVSLADAGRGFLPS